MTGRASGVERVADEGGHVPVGVADVAAPDQVRVLRRRLEVAEGTQEMRAVDEQELERVEQGLAAIVGGDQDADGVRAAGETRGVQQRAETDRIPAGEAGEEVGDPRPVLPVVGFHRRDAVDQDLDSLDAVDGHHPAGHARDAGDVHATSERALEEAPELRGTERRLLRQTGSVLRDPRLRTQHEHQGRRDDMTSSVHHPSPCSPGTVSAELRYAGSLGAAEVLNLTSVDLEYYLIRMRDFIDQVFEKSTFSGPPAGPSGWGMPAARSIC